MAQASTNGTLVYFNLQGKAQAIRYLLDHNGQAFEDKRITNEEWAAAKAAGTYGPVGHSLPAWIDGTGKKFTQSHAILSMLAA